MHKQSDFFQLAKKLSGPKYQLTESMKIQHLEKVEKQLHYLKNTFQIDYLNSNIQIGNPVKLPTRNNLEELTKLFPKLSAYTQQGIINHLKTLTSTTSDELLDYIQKLIHQYHSPSRRVTRLIHYYLVIFQYLLFKARCNLTFNMIWAYFSLKDLCANKLFKKFQKDYSIR